MLDARGCLFHVVFWGGFFSPSLSLTSDIQTSILCQYLDEQAGMAHACSDLKETIDGLHRNLLVGGNSATYRCKVKASQSDRVGTPKHQVGMEQDGH